MVSSAFAADFEKGPLISGFGPHASVPHGLNLNKNHHFNVAYDVAEQAEVGKVNRKFESLARFLNMHVANGVPAENIQLALVVHGKAVWDLTNAATYQDKFGSANTNQALIAELVKNGVHIAVCGQSAAYYQVTPNMLEKGVKMSLSAMTEHALLQQKGFTVNPF